MTDAAASYGLARRWGSTLLVVQARVTIAHTQWVNPLGKATTIPIKCC
jgi:hypothetical protein